MYWLFRAGLNALWIVITLLGVWLGIKMGYPIEHITILGVVFGAGGIAKMADLDFRDRIKEDT
jgi:threonine/homoserine efflux transporter RhtA